MCHAFQAAFVLISFFAAKIMFQVKRLPRSRTFVFRRPCDNPLPRFRNYPKIPCRPACASPICTDFDHSPRATTTFSSFFRFCATPIVSVALSICSFSSAASARIVKTSSTIRISACCGRESLHHRRPRYSLSSSSGLSSKSLSVCCTLCRSCGSLAAFGMAEPPSAWPPACPGVLFLTCLGRSSTHPPVAPPRVRLAGCVPPRRCPALLRGPLRLPSAPRSAPPLVALTSLPSWLSAFVEAS